MDYSQFFKSVKENQLLPVYLFHGEEEYIKEEAYHALVSHVLPQFEELNTNSFDTGSAAEIMSACDIPPFMAEKRIVVCRFLPKENDAKKLLDYIEHISKETILVFYIKGKADGKMGITKKLKSLGFEVLFDYLEETAAAKWIVKTALNSSCTISLADASFMVTLVGRDMLSIRNELTKLCDYVGESGVITKQIISGVVIKNLEYQLYNTYAFFMSGKFKDGFRSLDSIIGGKDRESEAMGIAGYFLSCLKATLIAYDLQKKNASTQEMEAKTGKKGYALKDLCANARKFDRQQLLLGISAFCNVAKNKIMRGESSYNTLVDAIIKTFGHIK